MKSSAHRPSPPQPRPQRRRRKAILPTIQFDGNLQPRDGTQARAWDVRAVIEVEDVGSALGQALVKELKGTTGRRIIRGVLGGFFKGR